MDGAQGGVQIGRYRVVETLGTGGMAIVYLARDPLLVRPVALKVLHPELAHDTEISIRFAAEARLAATVQHPNVVTIYEIGECDGRAFIAMEYLPQTLSAWLAQRGALAPEAAWRTLSDVAAGLAALHDSGIVHRDIKPSNILLAGDGTAKVADFGIARGMERTRLTRTGVLLGTPMYMSPEQVTGADSTPASDMYSLGLVVWEALIGRAAFEVGTPVEAAFRQCHEALPDPRSLRPDLPEWTSRLTRWLCAKDPSVRCPDGRTLLQSLHTRRMPALSASVTEGTRPPAESAPSTGCGATLSRRRTAASIAAIVSVVGLAALIAVGILAASVPSPGGGQDRISTPVASQRGRAEGKPQEFASLEREADQSRLGAAAEDSSPSEEETPVLAETVPSSRFLACHGSGHVWLVDTVTGEIEQVTECGGISGFDWSPDGERIAYSVDGTSGGARGLYVARADGSGATRLADSGESPRWSPDSRRLAYWSDGRYRVRTPGSAAGFTRLAEGGVQGDSEIVWSPDGRTLALAMADGPQFVSPDGLTRVVPLAETKWKGQFANHFSWAPDSSAIAATCGDTVVVIPVDGTPRPLLPDDPGVSLRCPCWSPDGRQIAYLESWCDPDIAVEGGPGRMVDRVRVVSASGGAPRALTHTFTLGWELTWSPDGEWIACTVVGEGVSEPLLVAPHGADWQILEDPDCPLLWAPIWVPTPREHSAAQPARACPGADGRSEVILAHAPTCQPRVVRMEKVR